jgi:hypothetical protein
MSAGLDVPRLTYVDKILGTVYGAAPPSRKRTIPAWIAGRETVATRTLVRFLASWGGCRAAASSFNQLLMPARWTLDGHYVVFATENQGVCRWAVSLKSSRPSVFQQSAGSTEWFREPFDLLPFLVTFCLWNGVNGGLKHRIVTDERASIRHLNTEFSAVDSRLGRLARSTRLYYADGAAVLCTKEQTGWRLHAGFRSRRMVEQFEERFAPAS